jgi:hypothetical protein
MIGGAPFDHGRGVKHASKLEAWVKPTTHAAAVRPGGTYLPGMREPSTDRWGKQRACDPPTFDLVVVARPLTVDLLPKQPGKKFASAMIPRTLMKRLPPDGWPSDHTSVVATVKAMNGTSVTVATWNVADPFYFGQFFPDAQFGFGREVAPLTFVFDEAEEASRLRAVEAHVRRLLELCDVVALQEVPSGLVVRLLRIATAADARGASLRNGWPHRAARCVEGTLKVPTQATRSYHAERPVMAVAAVEVLGKAAAC